MDLYTSYFEAKSFDRQLEIDASIVSNLENDQFDNVFVFVEKEIDLKERYKVKNNKLKELVIERVPTYKDWITHVRSGLPAPFENRSDCSIFCNSDISFDKTIDLAKKYIFKENSVICLSNFDKERPWWSQDTWGLSFENANKIDFLDDLELEIGQVRCDNKFAYKFAFNQWDIYNPCGEIKAYHNHKSGIRNYSKTDAVNLENVALVFPCKDEMPSRIYYAFVPFGIKNTLGIELCPYMVKGFGEEHAKEFENKMSFYNEN